MSLINRLKKLEERHAPATVPPALYSLAEQERSMIALGAALTEITGQEVTAEAALEGLHESTKPTGEA